MVKVTNRPSEGAASNQEVEYTYDPFNRLIGRSLDPDGEGGSASLEDTYFVYDGNQIVLQFDTTGSDPATKNDLSHRYLWVPGVDQILADEQVAAEKLYWPLGDHLGTVRDLAVYDDVLDETWIAEHRVYDAFGKLTAEIEYDQNGDPITPNPDAVDHIFYYTGRYRDPDTGLPWHLNRWYDPLTGRWPSEDPIWADANLYRYVGNSPTTATDPSGLHSAFGKCRENQKAANQAINQTVQEAIDAAAAVAARHGGDKSILRDELINRLLKAGRGAQVAGATGIYNLIYQAIQAGRIEATIPRDSTPLDGAGQVVRPSSPLIVLVTKDGKRVDVGIDKLGHFIEEGFTYYHIKYSRAKPIQGDLKKGERFARALGEWTEGLVPKGMLKDRELYDWLTEGTAGVYYCVGGEPFGRRRLKNLWGVFGDWDVNILRPGKDDPLDPSGLTASPADLAANLAGLRFLEDLMRAPLGKYKFDIGKYVTDDWSHLVRPNVPGATRRVFGRPESELPRFGGD